MPRMTHVSNKDADSWNRPDSYVGKFYFHLKTGHLYLVTDFGIDAQRELWLLFYERVLFGQDSDEANFTFVHTVTDFVKAGRFIEVKEN